MSSSKFARQFERFLFNGVPEHPEQTWERNGNGIVDIRHTGKSQSSSQSNACENNEDSEIIGKFIYHFEDDREEYIPFTK